MRIFVSLILVLLGLQAIGQVNPDLLRESPKDTVTKSDMNMDAVYSRPFLALGKSQTSIGGYIEADYNYIGEDGVTDGHSFRIPRMTLFVASTIKRRLKFLSEIELEEGGKEIAIEFAAVDFEIHPLLNLRGGVVMNPIGAFNQNHDGPKWEFVERPAAMTEMLAATWSNVGFGIYGKRYKEDWSFGYELYLTNGFDDSIIGNQENKTFLPASKANSERFEENSNGMPLFTGKAAIKHSKIAEIGLSYMTGVYNKFENDGLVVDQKRSVRTIAIDFNSTIRGIGTYVVGEWAWVSIDVPQSYSQQYADKQSGGFIDIVQPVLKKTIIGYENTIVNAAIRFEYVDWNVGDFNETGNNISDDLWSITPGISIRPSRQSVIRLNYTIKRKQDILGNPPAHIGGILIGISSYF